MSLLLYVRKAFIAVISNCRKDKYIAQAARIVAQAARIVAQTAMSVAPLTMSVAP